MLDEPTLRKSIELAVTTEKLGAAFYNTLSKRFHDDKQLNELFALLAKDEVVHETQFQSLLREIPPDDKSAKDDERYQYLAAVSISQFFASEDGLLSDVDKIRTKDDALGRAFALEKATLLYYHAIIDILGDHKILRTIIKAEKSHLVSVMKYLITDAKMRGLSDNW
jgi:rubrerythrin